MDKDGAPAASAPASPEKRPAAKAGSSFDDFEDDIPF
jgi:hypothetical protein